MPTPIGVKRIMSVLQNNQTAVHDAILAGRNPVEAIRDLVPRRPDMTVRDALSNTRLTDRNTQVFTALGMVETEPYKILMDAMRTAMKTIGNGENEREVPDWSIRRQAAKDILTLMGKDPKYEMRMNLSPNGNGGITAAISFGDVILQIGMADSEEEKLRLYDDIKRGVARKEITSQIIEGEYNSLPEEKF